MRQSFMEFYMSWNDDKFLQKKNNTILQFIYISMWITRQFN